MLTTGPAASTTEPLSMLGTDSRATTGQHIQHQPTEVCDGPTLQQHYAALANEQHSHQQVSGGGPDAANAAYCMAGLVDPSGHLGSLSGPTTPVFNAALGSGPQFAFPGVGPQQAAALLGWSTGGGNDQGDYGLMATAAATGMFQQGSNLSPTPTAFFPGFTYPSQQQLIPGGLGPQSPSSLTFPGYFPFSGGSVNGAVTTAPSQGQPGVINSLASHRRASGNLGQQHHQSIQQSLAGPLSPMSPFSGKFLYPSSLHPGAHGGPGGPGMIPVSCQDGGPNVARPRQGSLTYNAAVGLGNALQALTLHDGGAGNYNRGHPGMTAPGPDYLESGLTKCSGYPLAHANQSHHQQPCLNPALLHESRELYSRKVFVGGLPPDIDEDEIRETFLKYGSLSVDWPHKAELKSHFPPKGYAFLIFQHESSVKNLLAHCSLENDKWMTTVSSPTVKNKPVQIRPWCVDDADFYVHPGLQVDIRKTVFVGGVPRPLRAKELGLILNGIYGNVCYAGIDVDPDLKYPKGAGRVCFSSQQSYINSIQDRFVKLAHGDIDKKAELKPYVMDDQVCDECSGMNNIDRTPTLFCPNVTCLQYYCEACWKNLHRPGSNKAFHKPLVKEGQDRPKNNVLLASSTAQVAAASSGGLGGTGGVGGGGVGAVPGSVSIQGSVANNSQSGIGGGNPGNAGANDSGAQSMASATSAAGSLTSVNSGVGGRG